MLKDVRKALEILRPDIRSRMPIVLFSFLCLAILDALSIGLVFPLMLMVIAPDGQVPNWMSILPQPSGVSPELTLCALLLVIFTFKNIASILTIRWQYRLLSAAEAEVGTRLFRSYLQRPWQAVSQRNSSEMIRNASVSTSHAFLSFIIPVMTVIVEGMLVAAILTMLMLVEARVALSAFILLSVSAGLYYAAVRRKLAKVGSDFQAANLGLLQHLKQGIGAGREVRVLGRSAQFVEELAQARDLYADAQAKRAFFVQMPRFVLELVLVFAVVVAVVVALSMREPQEVAAIMAIFGVAALRLMTGANRILGALQQIRIGTEPLRIVHADLFDEGIASSRVAPDTVPEQAGLALSDLTFGYDPAHPVLKDLNLHVPIGTSLGLVGPSGGGKSTLIDMILGLLEPNAGVVSFNGEDISQDLSLWRSKIGFVPQSIYVTDDSIRRNVALGVPPEEIDDDAVWRALKFARLATFVTSLPDGLDTQLGDMGASVSGGQRQRIGIARALYHQPDVLILDEATSALDTETEAEINASIDALRGNITVIIVAHRLSTIQRCDRIIFLESGAILADGNYGELRKSSIDFQKLIQAASHDG